MTKHPDISVNIQLKQNSNTVYFTINLNEGGKLIDGVVFYPRREVNFCRYDMLSDGNLIEDVGSLMEDVILKCDGLFYNEGMPNE